MKGLQQKKKTVACAVSCRGQPGLSCGVPKICITGLRDKNNDQLTSDDPKTAKGGTADLAPCQNLPLKHRYSKLQHATL